MKIFSRALTLVFSLALATASHAVNLTGDALPPGPYSWVDGGPKSTNELNYLEQNPIWPNRSMPHVLFNSHTSNSVTLDFLNWAPGLAAFEYRIDGIQTDLGDHPIVFGDTIHQFQSLSTQSELLGVVFNANQYVDVRLALGGESDYRFDWVRFEVAPSSVPDAGGTLALLGLGLAAVGFVRRRA